MTPGRTWKDDRQLAAACCEGDEEAWREFRRRYFVYIHDFARRFVNDRAAADVADQVIADLWQRQRLAQYDGRSSLKTWLGAVVAHAALNAGKVERRMTSLDDAAAPPRTVAPSPQDEETRRLFATLVRQALAQLEPDDKLLLLLYYEQGLTLEQIEGLFGTSKATLSRRLDRLRRRLREAIDTGSRQQLQTPAAALLNGLDLARLDLDLAAALKGNEDDAV